MGATGASLSLHDRDRWDERYREQGAPLDPDPFLVESLAGTLPSGRALDLAGGGGRHALWLASKGWLTTLVDLSPEGVALAARRAREAEVEIYCQQWDLEAAGVPSGPWGVVVDFQYLHRPLLRSLHHHLAPGGLLVICHPTRRNLERNPRPSQRFLLEEGELPGLLDPSLEVVLFEESWLRDHHEARLVARRAC